MCYHFDHTFRVFRGQTLNKNPFIYKVIFLGYLIHFVLFDLDIYVQSYGCLKLHRSL